MRRTLGEGESECTKTVMGVNRLGAMMNHEIGDAFLQ